MPNHTVREPHSARGVYFFSSNTPSPPQDSNLCWHMHTFRTHSKKCFGPSDLFLAVQVPGHWSPSHIFAPLVQMFLFTLCVLTFSMLKFPPDQGFKNTQKCSLPWIPDPLVWLSSFWWCAVSRYETRDQWTFITYLYFNLAPGQLQLGRGR